MEMRANLIFTTLRKSLVKYKKKDKTGVINDPLGQTHSHASSEHRFRFKFVLFWLVGTDGRTDDMCKNNDPYRPRLWVGRVDQNNLLKWGGGDVANSGLVYLANRVKWISGPSQVLFCTLLFQQPDHKFVDLLFKDFYLPMDHLKAETYGLLCVSMFC